MTCNTLRRPQKVSLSMTAIPEPKRTTSTLSFAKFRAAHQARMAAQMTNMAAREAYIDDPQFQYFANILLWRHLSKPANASYAM